MYPDKTYTRKISISILKYSTLYTRPTLHCSVYSVNPLPLLIGWFLSKEGWRALHSLVMYGFCSNKVLYSASLSFTMFTGPAAIAQWVPQNRVFPFFLLSGYFLGIRSLVFSQTLARCWKPTWSGPWQKQNFLEKIFFPQSLEKWVISFFWIH